MNKDNLYAGGRTVCQFLDTGKTLGRHDGGRTGQNLESWHDADSDKKIIFCMYVLVYVVLCVPNKPRRQTDEIG